MRRAIVAIVGRPNVGKSTLFNRIVGSRRSVIEDYPGITRDRLYGDARWNDRAFAVVDTGGFQHERDEEFAGEVKQQILTAVEEADAIIMLLDAESGIVPVDYELSSILRKYGKNVFYAVNKIDGPNKEKKLLHEFHELGVDIFPLSALNGYGYIEFMDRVVSCFPPAEESKPEFPRIAIIGRPNVGKSTLVNTLLGKERMIVSPVPGTTRDAVDSLCSYYRKKYILVDTAGIRKKGKMARTVERYSFMRTVRNVESCDVAIVVFDASEGIVEIDQKIAGLVHAARKPSILLFNKWDLVDTATVTVNGVTRQIQEKLWFMRYAPVLTISSLLKKRVTKIFPIVDRIMKESARRIETHELNEFLAQALARQEPPLFKGKRVKIYYITQVRTNPPAFVVFVNYKQGIQDSYLRFLEGRLRRRFPFEGTPVEIYVRQKIKGK